MVTDRCGDCGARLEAGAERCPSCGRDLRLIIHVPNEEEPRRRLGPGWIRLLVVMGAAALLAGLWVLGKETGSPVGAVRTPSPSGPAPTLSRWRPLALGGGLFLCPPAAPYAAYDATHRFYPPNHPGHPAESVSPAACFDTVQGASAAGYALAPPPPGDRVVDGIYLGPVDLRTQCLRAARRLGFAVPCPTLLPAPDPGSHGPNCSLQALDGTGWTGCVVGGIFYLESGVFSALPNSQTTFSGGLDAVVVAARTHGRVDPFLSSFLTCPGAARPRRVSVPFAGGVGGTIVPCPVDAPPPLSGHDVVWWSFRGILYQVAVSRVDSGTAERVALAIASSIQLVR